MSIAKTLPRLSGDKKQIKTYAKRPADAKNPYEVKESSFGISLKAKKKLESLKISLVFDLENSCLHFATETECKSGEEPGSKKFMQTGAGKEYSKVPGKAPMKEGFLFLKPYYVKISTKAASHFKPGKLEIKQGVKEKKSFEDTVQKCRLIWVVVDGSSDKFPTLKETYGEKWDELEDSQKKALENYILIDKSKLADITKINYYQQSIDYAKSKGFKDANEEK